MDINGFKQTDNPSPSSPQAEPDSPPVNPKFDLENDAYVMKTQKKPSFLPYPAVISVFIILFIGSLYSVASLVSYAINKLLVGQQGLTQYDYSALATSDSFMVLFSVSWLIISLPTLWFLVRQLRRSEKNEPWRLSQKWRRVFYTVAMLVVSLSIIGVLTGTVYNLFETGFSSTTTTPSPVAPVYNSPLNDISPTPALTTTTPTNNKPLQLTSIALSGVIATALLIGSLFVLAHEYTGKVGRLIWIALSTLLIVGAVAGTFSVIKLYEPYSPPKTSPTRVPSTSPSIYSDPSCSSCVVN